MDQQGSPLSEAEVLGATPDLSSGQGLRPSQGCEYPICRWKESQLWDTGQGREDRALPRTQAFINKPRGPKKSHALVPRPHIFPGKAGQDKEWMLHPGRTASKARF
jgi:hypothetical protein